MSSITCSEGKSMAICFAASSKLGPTTANSPPPEGIAKLDCFKGKGETLDAAVVGAATAFPHIRSATVEGCFHLTDGISEKRGP